MKYHHWIISYNYITIIMIIYSHDIPNWLGYIWYIYIYIHIHLNGWWDSRTVGISNPIKALQKEIHCRVVARSARFQAAMAMMESYADRSRFRVWHPAVVTTGWSPQKDAETGETWKLCGKHPSDETWWNQILEGIWADLTFFGAM